MATTQTPGWFPDPSGTGQLRWWDGYQWTDTTQPATTVEPSPPASATGATRSNVVVGAGWALIAAGAAVVVGSFLPWVVVRAPFVGQLTKSGMEGSDGPIFCVLGAAAAALGIMTLTRPLRRWPGVVAVLLALAVGGFAIGEIADVQNRISSVDGTAVDANVGSGLGVIFGAAVVMLVAAVAALAKHRK
jgi:hypothetical protein